MGEDHAMTPAAERALGERIVRELFRDPDYLEDALLTEYVQEIWQALLAAARSRGELTPEIDERFAWQILMGRDRSVNAFALPGGFLGLHLGLIGVVASRDELASVLAHELSHVTQRHITRSMAQQNRQTPWLIGAMILGALAASKNPDAANALIAGGQAAAIQGQLNYSRDMEREADRIGFGVMTQAGFAAQGFVTMFDKLQQASRLNDTGAFPYLRTHPLTSQRSADLQARMALEPAAAKPSPSLSHALLAARARALAQPGIDMQRQWLAQAADPASRKQEPAAQVALLGTGLLSALQLRDFAMARPWVERLRELTRADPQATRIVRLFEVELALAAGEVARAETLLIGHDPKRRPELLLWAQARSASGHAAEAAMALQLWLSAHADDALAWQTLAAAYSAQGQALRAIRSEAEAQVARLDLPAAVDRLKAAQQQARRPGAAATPAADIDAALIDSRLRQLESRLAIRLKEEAAQR